MVDCRDLPSPLPPPAMDFGGHDCEFVEEVPDHLTCIVCLGAFNEPHLLSCCGKKVCYTCITRIKNAGQPCPHCRELNFFTMLDKDFDRQVLNLKVYCSNKNNGCGWSDDLRQLNRHLEDCDYVAIPCRWGCGLSFVRQALTPHEDDECPQRPAELKLKSAVDKMEDRVVILQRKVLDLETLCGDQRKEIERVNNTLQQSKERHTREIEEVRTQLQEQREVNQRMMNKFEEKRRTNHEQVLRLVGEQENRLGQLKKQVEQELHYTIDQATEDVRKDIERVQVNVGRKMDNMLTIQEDRLEEMRQETQAQLNENFATIQSVRRLQDVLEQTSRHGKKVPEWQLPVPVMALSDVVPCQYTMYNFSLHKGGQKTWYSPSFYNEPGGYKFCLRVDSHGMLEGKATHLSVWVYLMKGLHDEVLKWPFSGKITVQLLNWKTDRSHIQNVIAFDNQAGDKVRQRVTLGEVAATGRGSSRFVSHEILRGVAGKGQAEFVKDDCLCFRIWKVDIV